MNPAIKTHLQDNWHGYLLVLIYIFVALNGSHHWVNSADLDQVLIVLAGVGLYVYPSPLPGLGRRSGIEDKGTRGQGDKGSPTTAQPPPHAGALPKLLLILPLSAVLLVAQPAYAQCQQEHETCLGGRAQQGQQQLAQALAQLAQLSQQQSQQLAQLAQQVSALSSALQNKQAAGDPATLAKLSDIAGKLDTLNQGLLAAKSQLQAAPAPQPLQLQLVQTPSGQLQLVPAQPTSPIQVVPAQPTSPIQVVPAQPTSPIQVVPAQPGAPIQVVPSTQPGVNIQIVPAQPPPQQAPQIVPPTRPQTPAGAPGVQIVPGGPGSPAMPAPQIVPQGSSPAPQIVPQIVPQAPSPAPPQIVPGGPGVAIYDQYGRPVPTRPPGAANVKQQPQGPAPLPGYSKLTKLSLVTSH